MDNNLAQTAITLALECKWSEATKINNKIIENDPTNIDALNRLSKAFYELGKVKKAKLLSKKVLEIDFTNKIAKKSLEKYRHNKPTNKPNQLIYSDFLEDIGKTKLTTLINLGSIKTVTSLNSGDEVILLSHSHRVTINSCDGIYIGKLPDNLAARIRILIKEGNKYKVLVKSVDKQSVKIFIREVSRGKGYENVQSFPQEEILESLAELNS